MFAGSFSFVQSCPELLPLWAWVRRRLRCLCAPYPRHARTSYEHRPQNVPRTCIHKSMLSGSTMVALGHLTCCYIAMIPHLLFPLYHWPLLFTALFCLIAFCSPGPCSGRQRDCYLDARPSWKWDAYLWSFYSFMPPNSHDQKMTAANTLADVRCNFFHLFRPGESCCLSEHEYAGGCCAWAHCAEGRCAQVVTSDSKSCNPRVYIDGFFPLTSPSPSSVFYTVVFEDVCGQPSHLLLFWYVTWPPSPAVALLPLKQIPSRITSFSPGQSSGWRSGCYLDTRSNRKIGA